MINKVVFATFVIAAIYYLMAAVALHCFLSALIFVKVPVSTTHETQRYQVEHAGASAVIRAYISAHESGCALFFPGQHGGIDGYETPLFTPLNARGISVYAISYPGYEGAKGSASFANVLTLTQSAVAFIEQMSSCRIAESVFIGRSLGAAIALENALVQPPKALLLDGVAASLAGAIRQKFSANMLLKPLQLLPVESLLQFELELTQQLSQLHDVAVVIFQGDQDQRTPLTALLLAVTSHPQLDLNAIKGGIHADAWLKAGPLYFDKLCQQIRCAAP
ncbi:alpha/beta hydrolase [Shewanella avicenniae]|uniref:Alpha/beta hydrolase n=1 Tax=Shewanella avicenniae TaxID=2814294 RepID=A0ABX7QML8_9GAMM|nr:alpha/beta hydrolase [Shewanella avicenniae]QSX32245.1 alpha/beta hydrolase [Shewanella avicenniae]